MICLPNLPPYPRNFSGNSFQLSPELLSERSSLTQFAEPSRGGLLDYVDKLEQYLDKIFTYIKKKNLISSTDDGIQVACQQIICETNEIPWIDILFYDVNTESRTLNKVLKSRSTPKDKIDWSLANELQAIVLAIVSIYIRLGSNMINDLIEVNEVTTREQVEEGWKKVVESYKKAISFCKFGRSLCEKPGGGTPMNPIVFLYFEKISEICIQISILCKCSAFNRYSYNESENFKSGNNGTLARVAIYILSELKSSRCLLNELEDAQNSLGLNYKLWTEYLNLIEKYIAAYAGLFLSIESYQRNELGKAIGLVNFSLLSLQSKQISELNLKGLKVVGRFKNKFLEKKNEDFIKTLKSNTSMKIESSAFKESSGVVLKDLSYLFDQLVRLHLKFSKENDNLSFQTVEPYKDIATDLKWPMGSKIPMSEVTTYEPSIILDLNEDLKCYPGRGTYY